MRSSPVSASAPWLLALGLAACGGGGSGGGKPPTQPANGAPLALEVVKFTAGADRDGTVTVKGYNFSDKSLAQYTIAVRYTDKAGAPIKVGVGTPFEKDVAWTSMSGKKFLCKPKSWCTFEVRMIEVPAGTAKAEAAVTGATALKADGFTFEEQELWASSKGMSDWPL